MAREDAERCVGPLRDLIRRSVGDDDPAAPGAPLLGGPHPFVSKEDDGGGGGWRGWSFEFSDKNSNISDVFGSLCAAPDAPPLVMPAQREEWRTLDFPAPTGTS